MDFIRKTCIINWIAENTRIVHVKAYLCVTQLYMLESYIMFSSYMHIVYLSIVLDFLIQDADMLVHFASTKVLGHL